MSDTEFIIEPGRQDVVMRRVFDAPPEVVFKAITDPDLVPNWWGPREYTTVVDRHEPRHGGLWRFVSRGDDGSEFAFRGVFHDVIEPERIAWTFEFEGAPGAISLETLTLEEVDGKTRYAAVSVHESVEARDAVVASGMKDGASESMDRLAEVVEGLR
ncbi:MAG: SRPBCC family protein [Nitriliruptorales bacterium]